jgi:histidinol-phosphatase
MEASSNADLGLALRLAEAADRISMQYFTGAPVAFDVKADGTPVSEADVAVERELSEIIAAQRPGDCVLGEEVGECGSAARRWIIDGIDWTVVFVDGGRGWATEIALEVDGQIAVGVSSSPADGVRYWAARGEGAWRVDSEGEPIRIHCSGRSEITGSRYSAIPPLDALPEDVRQAVAQLDAAFDYVAPAVHGALLVAAGTIEACVQPIGGPWDFAALALIVEEAGGRFSDMTGHFNIHEGGPVVYSNAHVHAAVLDKLR